MARKNFLAQSSEYSTNLLSKLNSVEKSNNYTDEVIEKVDESSLDTQLIHYFSPAVFVPYFDEKLRLGLHTGEKREQLKESIALNGIMQPVIITEQEGKWMILAGHNRVDIAKELNIDVPCIIKKNLSKDQMDLFIIDNNLLNRQVVEELKPSQLAYLFKTKMDAEKHQGTLSTGFTKYTGEQIGEEIGISRAMVHRYIKLNDLIPEALSMVDNKELTMKSGYELSFCDKKVQQLIISYVPQIKLNDKFLRELKFELKEKEFETEEDVLTFVKSQLLDVGTIKKQQHVIDYRNVKSYIPHWVKKNEVESYVIKALEFYNKNNTENQ